MQVDAELGEILMRAFVLRRAELIASGVGDAVLVGSSHSARHAARTRIPDPQRPSVRLHRSRSRSRYAGAARSLPHQRDRHPGADLPRRAGPEKSLRIRRSPTVSGSTTRSIASTSAISWSSAPAPRALRPRSMEPQKDSTCWCSRGGRRADRPARARGSRTTWAFRPASRVASSPTAPTSRPRSSAHRLPSPAALTP